MEDNYFEQLLIKSKLMQEAKEFFRSFLYDTHLLQPNMKHLEDRVGNFDIESGYLLLELKKLDFETFDYSKLGRLQIMMGFFKQSDLVSYQTHFKETYKLKEFIPLNKPDYESFENKNDPKQYKINFESERKRIKQENEVIETYNLKYNCMSEFLVDNIIPDIYPNPDISIEGLIEYTFEFENTDLSDIEIFMKEVIQHCPKTFETVRRIGLDQVVFYTTKEIINDPKYKILSLEDTITQFYEKFAHKEESMRKYLV